MSTIRANTLTDAAGNNASTTAQLAQGRAKAWFNLNGTGTIAERDSFNVSSYVDNGVGDYTANWATALANANYMAAGSGRFVSGDSPSSFARAMSPSVFATGSLRFFSQSNGATDFDIMNVAVHGD